MLYDETRVLDILDSSLDMGLGPSNLPILKSLKKNFFT